MKSKPNRRTTIRRFSSSDNVEDGKCDTCGKYFGMVMRIESNPNDKACMTCFGNRVGSIELSELIGKLSKDVVDSWSTELLEFVDFTKLSVPQLLREEHFIQELIQEHPQNLDKIATLEDLGRLKHYTVKQQKNFLRIKATIGDVLEDSVVRIKEIIENHPYTKQISTAQKEFNEYIDTIVDENGMLEKDLAVDFAQKSLRKHVKADRPEEKKHLDRFVDTIEDVIFTKDGKRKIICPRCDHNELKYPMPMNARSRTDNKTYICSDCGTDEALEGYGKSKARLNKKQGIDSNLFRVFIEEILPSNVNKNDPIEITNYLMKQYLAEVPDRKWLEYFIKAKGSVEQLKAISDMLKKADKNYVEEFRQMIIEENKKGLRLIGRGKALFISDKSPTEKIFMTKNGKPIPIGEKEIHPENLLPIDFENLDVDAMAEHYGESPEHIAEIKKLCIESMPLTTDDQQLKFASKMVKINRRYGKIKERKEKYLSFDDAREWTLKQKCHSRQDWINLTKTDQLNTKIPIHPETFYKPEFQDKGGFPNFCGFEQKVRRESLTKNVLDGIIKEFGKRWLDYSLYPDALLTNWFDTQGLFSVKDPYYKEFFSNFIRWRNDPEGITALRYWIETLDFTKNFGDYTLVHEEKKHETKEEFLDRTSTTLSDVRVTPLLVERPPIGVEKIMLEANSVVPNIDDQVWFDTQVDWNKQLLWYAMFDAEELGTDEFQKIKQTKKTGNIFHDTILDSFIEEYQLVKELNYGRKFYTYRVEPKLIQLYTAYKMRTKNFYFNMSSTGTYKTGCGIISAVASKTGHVMVICPVNIIHQWRKNIKLFYRESYVSTGKEINPNFWENAQKYKPRFHIINYDKFGREKGAEKIIDQVQKKKTIDFVIIDESHFIKNTNDDEKYISNRRKYIEKLIDYLRSQNRNLKILMLTATPVVNNIREGKSLLEMGTGTKYPLSTYSTIRNATKLYTEFLPFSVNWTKNYDIEVRGGEKPIKIDAFIPESYSDEQIMNLNWNELEQIATKYRIPKIIEILKNSKGKTVIYTDYVTGIVPQLVEAVTNAGYKVGEFTGSNKTGLVEKTGEFEDDGQEKIFNQFVYGDLQVLIASRPFAVGVDEIQYACNNLIMNGLVWTWAQFEQIRGRIIRSGQIKDHVNIHMIFAKINGFEYDQKIKYNRLLAKKALGDCIKTGTLPEKIRLGDSDNERLDILQQMIKNRETGFPDKERIEAEYSQEMQKLIENKIEEIEHKIPEGEIKHDNE